MRPARAIAFAAAAVALWWVPTAFAADTAQPYFKGKNIKLVIATGPGGAYGLYGLLLTQHLGRHIAGNPAITPEYRSGAGGTVAANYLYGVAPKDGTVIGMPLAPFVLAQITGASGVQYDAARFNWIGQIGDMTRMLVVRSASTVKSFADLTTQEVAIGSSGRGSETYMNPALMNAVFGTRLKIIDGYKGSSDLMLALERGEIVGTTSTWSNISANHGDWLRDGKIRLIVQIGLKKVSAYPSVPLLTDLAKSEDDRRLIELMSLTTTAVGYSVMAPPGVPKEIIAELRTAFDETMRDPAFLADADKRRADVEPAGHEQVAAGVARALNAPKAILARFVAAVGAK